MAWGVRLFVAALVCREHAHATMQSGSAFIMWQRTPWPRQQHSRRMCSRVVGPLMTGQRQPEHSSAQLHEWLCAVGFTLQDYGDSAHTLTFQNTQNKHPMRVADALQLVDPSRFPTASAAKKIVRKGAVLVNGRPARIDQQVVLGTDRLQLHERAPTLFSPQADPPFHVSVLYEDDWMAAVHKPPGVSTQPPIETLHPSPDLSHTMRCAVPYFLAPSSQPDVTWRPMICHRLDKLTEGILLVAKTKSACTGITDQFKARSLTKHYVAVVHGSPPSDTGTVDLDVGGKAAVTDWTVMETPTLFPHQETTALALQPHHGRTHQIRIHCARGLGLPIVGDPLFPLPNGDERGGGRGGARGDCEVRWQEERERERTRGLLLAAVGVDLLHPITGAQLSFRIAVPDRFNLNAAALGSEETDSETAKNDTTTTSPGSSRR